METNAGASVVLCASCADPTQPFIKRWALMDDREALAGMGTVMQPDKLG